MACPAQGISLEKAHILSAPTMHILYADNKSRVIGLLLLHCFFLLSLARLAQGLSLHILLLFLGN